MSLLVKSLKAKYPKLFPLDDLKSNLDILIKENLKYKRLVFTSKNNHYKVAFFSYLLQNGVPKADVINSYDVIETYLSNNADYVSITNIDKECMCITHGFNEPENKRLLEYTSFVISNLCNKNRNICLYLKGGIPQGLSTVIQENEFVVINLDNLLKGVPSVVSHETSSKRLETDVDDIYDM